MIYYAEGGEATYGTLKPSAFDRLKSRVNSVSNRVSQITPYEVTKTAYIDDTEVEFYKAKQGTVIAECVTQSGLVVPTTIEYTDNKIIVHFAALDEVANVTIIIQ